MAPKAIQGARIVIWVQTRFLRRWESTTIERDILEVPFIVYPLERSHDDLSSTSGGVAPQSSHGGKKWCHSLSSEPHEDRLVRSASM